MPEDEDNACNVLEKESTVWNYICPFCGSGKHFITKEFKDYSIHGLFLIYVHWKFSSEVKDRKKLVKRWCE